MLLGLAAFWAAAVAAAKATVPTPAPLAALAARGNTIFCPRVSPSAPAVLAAVLALIPALSLAASVALAVFMAAAVVAAAAVPQRVTAAMALRAQCW
jgi:hypothetical protein